MVCADPRASADLSLSLYIHCSEESDIPSHVSHIHYEFFANWMLKTTIDENALNLKKFINQVNLQLLVQRNLMF